MKELKVRLMAIFLAAVVTVHFQYDAAADTPTSAIASLAIATAKLPSQSMPEKLKVAAIKWVLHRARVALLAGRSSAVRTLLADARHMLAEAPVSAGAEPPNLFPHIPDFRHNPVATQFCRWVRQFLKKPTPHYPYSQMPKSWILPHRVSENALLLAEALCDRQSPFFGDPTIVAPLLERFDYIYRTHQPGDPDLGDFGYSPIMTEMYLMVKSVFPGILPPSKQTQWQRSLKANIHAVVKADLYTGKSAVSRFMADRPYTAYPNADVHYIITLIYAHMLFPDHNYLDMAKKGLRFLYQRAEFADGGFTYIDSQDECYTYHGIDIISIARAWELTHDPIAMKMLKSGKNYYPLSVEPLNVAEYYTAPSWKHYWNRVHGEVPAMIEAKFNRSSQNMRVALMNKPKGDLIQAAYWGHWATPAPAPNGYFVFDRNIQGPRGRFGTFSFAGVGRKYVGTNSGKSTYVGCMVGFPPGRQPTAGRWPMSAALQDVASEVCIKPASSDPDDWARYSHYAALSQHEHNAVVVGRRFATLCTVYRLSRYGQPAIAWKGRQEWIFTRNRLIGWVTLTSMKTQDAAGVDGTVLALSSESWRGADRKFDPAGTHRWRYGSLVIHVLASDYAHESDHPTSMFSPARLHARRMILWNHLPKTGHVRLYRKGTHRYFLLAIHPVWTRRTPPVVHTRLSAGLMEIRVNTSMGPMLLIHNPTGRTITFHIREPWAGEAWIHRAGEQFRPAWIATSRHPTWINRAEKCGKSFFKHGIRIDGYSSLTLTAWK